ncbi:MAG: hypothetical protein A2284_05085 [Deltaproteobacteria bacterium RIFOXYA12_FULL_61_11]|nr:MAG: hypothetical protein A2284_05085 [Deltaproteobacteria bacterium RIFOXYA12_FULL_61_11]
MTTERIIKKYQNRKLYDVLESRYVTLTELADFIQAGDRLRVVDNVTEADLTPMILTEILLEQEKVQAGEVPTTLLKEIIRNGDGSIFKFLQRFVVGAGENRGSGVAELREFIANLHQAGELNEQECAELNRELDQKKGEVGERLDQLIEQNIGNALNKIKRIYKMQKDIQRLRTKVVNLERQAERIERTTN